MNCVFQVHGKSLINVHPPAVLSKIAMLDRKVFLPLIA